MLSKKLSNAMFVFFGILFMFFAKTEKELAERGNLLWTAEFTGKTVLFSLVFGSILGIALSEILYRLAMRKQRQEKTGPAKAVCGWNTAAVFFGSMFFTLLAWVPAYLAYYPGICAYDFPVQLDQIVNDMYIDHHPIAHTLLLRGAIISGRNIFGSANTGIAVFTALQMIFLAGAMAYGIAVLKRAHAPVRYLILLQLCCMFFPFHWYMSISMTKDIIFSAFVLLFLTAMTAELWEGRNRLRAARYDVLLAISGVGIILFRNNGRYAFLVLLLCLGIALWRGKKRRLLWGRLLLWCGAAFCAGNIFLTLLFHAVDGQPGDKRECLSVPIQQLARVMVYHGGVDVLPEDDGKMEEKDRALIGDFLLEESYRLYRPDISDPVKRYTNTYVVRYRTREFLDTYFRLLAQYPGDFVNAALALDAGYFYPGDVTHAHVNEEEGARNKGYVQTRWDDVTLNAQGIFKDSKWKSLHQILEKWAEENTYLKWPVLKYLFVPGSYLYFYLLLFGWLMLRRLFRLCAPLAFVLGYYLTLFLGPTVQLRYIYPLMLVLPFLWAWTEIDGAVELGREDADAEII